VYETKNTQIDLLDDSITEFQEMAARVGFNYGVVVYDDRDVLVLREPGPAETEAERAETSRRYSVFRDRRDGDMGRPGDRAWLDQRLARWKPSDATATVIGIPKDGEMFQEVIAVKREFPNELVGMTVIKTQRPGESLDELEQQADGAGVFLNGVAAGPDCDDIARYMFRNTEKAPDLHEVREKLGDTCCHLLDLA
jgi:hypothetical protein